MTSSSRNFGIRLNRPFLGIPSFPRTLIETNLDALDADIAVIGAPLDEGSPFLICRQPSWERHREARAAARG